MYAPGLTNEFSNVAYALYYDIFSAASYLCVVFRTSTNQTFQNKSCVLVCFRLVGQISKIVDH